ncbi:MAG: hypothetical protein KIT69_21220, partial [Propionibacteriaceae bacterium]|nr:hypothetical protein [Propionibacteriaceae bacterium]
MPLSRSAIAWAVSGTLGVGTCTLGIMAMNSGMPANADPQPAIVVGATAPASPTTAPPASPSPEPTLTASTAPTAVSAKTPVSAKT